MKTVGRVAFGVVISALVIGQVWALSPPEYTLQKRLLKSIGAGPCVHVGNIYQNQGSDDYFIDVKGCSAAIAGSLSIVLKRDHRIGNLHIIIRVLGPDGNEALPVEEAADKGPVVNIRKHFTNVLGANPYFSTIHRMEDTPMAPDLFIEMKKDVIQYWNDDLSDYYSNANEVAATVFRDFCKSAFVDGKVDIGWTTAQDAVKGNHQKH